MAMLREYREKFRYLSRVEVVQERRTLFKAINGDAFFPLKSWPLEMQFIFWKKPMGDRDAFKLLLFGFGNGCSPHLICPWVQLAQSWAPDKAEKRARQIDFVVNNIENKRGVWFYFDVDYGRVLYLNGLPRPI